MATLEERFAAFEKKDASPAESSLEARFARFSLETTENKLSTPNQTVAADKPSTAPPKSLKPDPVNPFQEVEFVSDASPSGFQNIVDFYTGLSNNIKVPEFVGVGQIGPRIRKTFKAITEEIPHELVSPEAAEDLRKIFPESLVPDIQAAAATLQANIPEFMLWGNALKAGTIPAKIFPKAAAGFKNLFRGVKGVTAGAIVTEVEREEGERNLLDFLINMGIGGLAEIGFSNLTEWASKKKVLQKDLKEIITGKPPKKSTAKAVQEKIGEIELKKMGNASKTRNAYEEMEKEIIERNKFSPKKIIKALNVEIVDRAGNVKLELRKSGELGETAIRKFELAAGASAEGNRQFQAAYKRIYEGKSPYKKKILDRMIAGRRTVAIDRYRSDIKHSKALTGEMNKDYFTDAPNSLRKEIGEKLYNELSIDADDFFSVAQAQLVKLRGHGLLTQESFEALISKGDYSPRKFLKHMDPIVTHNFGGKTTSMHSSGVGELTTGSEDAMLLDSSLFLAEMITRAEGRIAVNKANKALYDLAVAQPKNGIIETLQRIGVTKTGKPKYPKIKAGFSSMGVVIDGRPKTMIMPNEFAREWVGTPPMLNATDAKWIEFLSGTSFLRASAVGLNPTFFLSNLPRDLQHIWYTTEQFSSTLPVAVFQMGKELGTVATDAILRKGRAIDYIKQGGGMDWLTHQGQFKFIEKNKTLKTLQQILSWTGETSEIWARLALREKTINNALARGETRAAAEELGTHAGRTYMDFSQGGRSAKAANKAVTFLNARIQGTRGLVRAFKKSPVKFLYKTAQLMGVSSLLYSANKMINPEASDQISSADKRNFFTITLPSIPPFYIFNEAGEKSYMYLILAKDQGQRIVTTISDAMMAKQYGDEVDIEGVTDAAKDFIPLLPQTSLSPFIDAVMGYYSNKDFWLNEDIWGGPEVKPHEEIPAGINPAFVEFAKVTGASPARLRYAVSRFFTNSNIITDIVGGKIREITDQLTNQQLSEKDQREIFRGTKDIPGLRRVVRFTNPRNKRMEVKKKIKIQFNTERVVRNREFFKLLDRIDLRDTKEITEFLKKQPPELLPGFKTILKRSLQIKDIPNKPFWIDLMDKELSPEAKATFFWQFWRVKNEEGKKDLIKDLNRVPGVKSKRFTLRFNSLQKRDIKP